MNELDGRHHISQENKLLLWRYLSVETLMHIDFILGENRQCVG